MTRVYHVAYWFRKKNFWGTEQGLGTVSVTMHGARTIDAMGVLRESLQDELGYDTVLVLNLLPLEEDLSNG